MILIIWILFTGLGYWFYFEAENLQDVEIRYDDICEEFRGTETDCEVTFLLETDLENPKVYYRLDNFYANHRSFQKYSFSQLRGEDEAKIAQCDPVKSNKDILEDVEKWDLRG